MVTSKLTGWRYIGDYEGQHPGYAELDDPPHPVKVKVYGRGSNRKALNELGQVEFTYTSYPQNMAGIKKPPSGFEEECPHISLVLMELESMESKRPGRRIWRE